MTLDMEVSGPPKIKLDQDVLEDQRARVFSNQIREAYEKSIGALKRLGVIREINTKGGTIYLPTDKMLSTDFSEIPPYGTTRPLISQSPKVTIEFSGGSSVNQLLTTTWIYPDSVETIGISPRRFNPDQESYNPYLSWRYEKKGQVIRTKTFAGRFGNDENSFSQRGWLMGEGSLKHIVAGLEAIAKKVPHPNPIARILGR